MSTKISEMYNETSIQRLPDEMLEHILLFLDLDDRRSALQVCRRWSTIKLWSSFQLVVDFNNNRGQEANYHRTLLASSRQYKHLVFHFGYDANKYELLVEIVQHFSHKMETLKLIKIYVPVKQKLISQMLSLCSNLRHLNIGSAYIGFGSNDLEISPMHKLEELYLEADLLPNMMNITPNITRLLMLNHCYSEEAKIFLRHFSSQLVELEFWFHWRDYFWTVCEMQFPLLEKLNFSCSDVEINLGGSFTEVETIDLFFHKLPLLKEVILSCDFDDRVIQNLSRSCVNIQFLWMKMSHFSPDTFRAICELKNLKRLGIEEATVEVPTDMYSPLTSLQKLTLYRTHIVHQVEFNSFVQRAFPNLSDVELLELAYVNNIDGARSIELFGQIFSNFSSLQRLAVSQPGTITLGQFLEFCASHAPKELRFKCWKISDITENEIPNRIPVQKLVLHSPPISPTVLQKLVSSMKQLRWLEIALGKYCAPKEISMLREQFPRCYVVAKRTVVIEEPRVC